MSSLITKITFGAVIVILLSVGGGLIWYPLFYEPAEPAEPIIATSTEPLFPIGEGLGETVVGTSTATSTLGVISTGGGVRAWELASNPIAGFGIFGGATSTTVVAVDKSTGHVYRMNIASGTVDKLSNSTMVGIQEAYVGETKSNYYIISRYEGNSGAQTYIQTIKKSVTASTNVEVGTFISDSIVSIALSPKKDRYATVVRGKMGGILYITDFASGKKRELFRSPLNEWNVSWPSEGTLALETKGSSQARGVLLLINSQTGASTRAMGNIPGLTALIHPNASQFVFAESRDKSGFNLFLYTIKTGDITPLSFQVPPTSCMWSKKIANTLYCSVPDALPTAEFPDSWYRGEVSTETKIWKFNVKTGESDILWNPRLAGGTRGEALSLNLDSGETLLFYIEKSSQTLWSLRLTDL